MSSAMLSPESSLDELSAVPALVDGRAAIEIPDRWQQGRGLFGGLVAAKIIRALEQAAPDRPLRSLTLEICGPVQAGRADLAVEVLRAGNAVTTAAARIVQGGVVQAHGVGVLGTARGPSKGGERSVLARGAHLQPPHLPAWDALAPPPFEQFAPAFAQHVEFRTAGPLPFAGGSEARLEGWLRWKRPGTRRDAAFLAACADAHWPALFSTMRAPRPMATIAFTFQPLASGDEIPDTVAYRAQVLAEDSGYCVELRELWSPDGRLLALNEQTFVVIK